MGDGAGEMKEGETVVKMQYMREEYIQKIRVNSFKIFNKYKMMGKGFNQRLLFTIQTKFPPQKNLNTNPRELRDTGLT